MTTYSSIRDRKPNALLNTDRIRPKRNLEDVVLKESVGEAGFFPTPTQQQNATKRFATSYDKDVEEPPNRKKLFIEMINSEFRLKPDSRNSVARSGTTLHQMPEQNLGVNLRYEENKNSYFNIFGYFPSFIEDDKFAGSNNIHI